MESKFTYYDLIAHIVPGTVIWVAVGLVFSALGYSPGIGADGLAALGLGAVLIYVSGELVQALSSWLEPLYFRLWGGKPSTRVLATQTKQTSLEQLRLNMARRFGLAYPSESFSSDDEFFRLCISLAKQRESERLRSFQASYALHRSLLTVGLIGFFGGLLLLVLDTVGMEVLAQGGTNDVVLLMIGGGVTTSITFFRARQRAYYYVREVLDSAYLAATAPDATTSSAEEDSCE